MLKLKRLAAALGATAALTAGAVATADHAEASYYPALACRSLHGIYYGGRCYGAQPYLVNQCIWTLIIYGDNYNMAVVTCYVLANGGYAV